MITRVLAATLAGAIAAFLLGYLIFGVLLNSYMTANVNQYAGMMKTPPNFMILIGANLVFAWLLAFVGDYWAGVRNFASGAKLGALITFPVVLWSDLQFEAFMNLYIGFVPIIVNVLAATVLGTIVGGVIGLVLGIIDKKQATV
jgi:hypothetical protein